MKKKCSGEFEKNRLFELLETYHRNDEKVTGQEILDEITMIITNAYRYMIGRNPNRFQKSDRDLRKEAVTAASNALWIKVTDKAFFDDFKTWQNEMKEEERVPQNAEPIALFPRYIRNLAARIMFRLSKDEFPELYNLLSRKYSVQHLEDLKVQVSDSPLLKAVKRRWSTTVISTAEIKDEDLPMHFLKEDNPFVMQAFKMIRNKDHRDILYKYDIKGILLTQIADERGIPRGTARQWHKRGLNDLKENLIKVLQGKWGKNYEKALAKIRKNYAHLGEPYMLRLKLLQNDINNRSLDESLEELLRDGTLPPLSKVSFEADPKSFKKTLTSLRTFPFLDARLQDDAHFKDCLYEQLEKKCPKEEHIRYIYLHVLDFHIQEIMWALYETFKDINDLSPQDGACAAQSPDEGAKEKEHELHTSNK